MKGHSLASPGRLTQRDAMSKWLNTLALVLIFYLTAAASFSGYFGKWAFFDGHPNQGIVKVFDGSAIRPWIYRQLMPTLADALVEAGTAVVPQSLQDKIARRLVWFPELSPEATFARASAIDEPGMRLRYLALYYLTFASFLGSMFVMRRICLEMKLSNAAATLAPLLFALVFPLLLTRGGYYYDAPELLLLSASVLLAIQGRWVWLVLLTIPATFNKEAYLFFVPSLFPLLTSKLTKRQTASVVAFMLLISGAINAATKYQFRANGGEMAMWQLDERVRFFLDWGTYVRVEINYGVLTAAGINALNLTLLVALVYGHWRSMSSSMQRHSTIAAAINIPLFLAFGYADELRNLSFLFPSMVVMMACWIAARLDLGDSHVAIR